MAEQTGPIGRPVTPTTRPSGHGGVPIGPSPS